MKDVGKFYGYIFGLFYCHSVHFMAIWYFWGHFGTLCQEKSGNPDVN
jgi:hypothetical protein